MNNNTFKIFPTLYAVSKSGAVRTYIISVDDYPEKLEAIVTTSKQMKLNGKITKDTYLYNCGKNIGKVNATTYLQQALSESQSMFNKLLDKGFTTEFPSESKKFNTDANGLLKPMLASSDTTKIKFPCICQPKYDGVRCTISIDDVDDIHIVSRLGKKYNIPHLKKWADEHRDLLPLDGELYNHKEMSFQEIISAVKKLSPLTSKIKYVVYDKPISTNNNAERINILSRTLSHLTESDPIILSPHCICYNMDDVKKYHDMYVEDGYEGIILRNELGDYEFGFKSNDLIKYKEFNDDEFVVADVIEGSGRDSGTGIFVLYLHGRENEPITSDNTFKAKPKGNKKLRSEYFKHREKYINKLATVKYQGLSTFGVPRFPNMIAIRDYE